MDTWNTIKSGREAFGGYLAGLSPEQWERPSLCAQWSVKEVAAHMLVIPTMSKGQVFKAFVGSGFNLDKMNDKLVKKISTELSSSEIAARTSASAGSRNSPPGLKLPGVLTELAVHSSDISEAVGEPFELPVEAYVAALDHLKTVQPVFKSKARIAGLRLQATDTDWSWGNGPGVEAPARLLLLAVAGRPSVLDRVSGDGVSTLRSR